MGSVVAMPKLIAGLISIALVLSLAACGEKDGARDRPSPTAAAQTGDGEAGGGSANGGGGGASLGPEEGVTAAVEAVVGGGVPAEACEEFATSNYVKAAYGDAKGCEAAVEAGRPGSGRGLGVEVSGTKATAKAEPQNGPNKGETLDGPARARGRRLEGRFAEVERAGRSLAAAPG